MSQEVTLWPSEEIRKALKPIPDQQELADIARQSFIKHCLPHLPDNAADYYRVKYQLAEVALSQDQNQDQEQANSYNTAENASAHGVLFNALMKLTDMNVSSFGNEDQADTAADDEADAAETSQSEITSDTARATPKTYLPLVCRFNALVEHLSQGIQERQQAIAVGLLAAIAGVNVFLYGPPGVAKSLVARRIASAFTGNFFEISLHKYVTVDEVFGPISLHALKNDTYVRNSVGFLPQADFAFLDELGKANGAVLNSLLTLLNNSAQAQIAPASVSGLGSGTGSDSRSQLKFTLAAANEIPEQAALFDRFAVRLPVEPVSSKLSFHQMLLDEPVRDNYEPPKTFAQLLTQLEGFEQVVKVKTTASQLNLEQKVDVVAFFRRLELLEAVSVQKYKLNQLVQEQVAEEEALQELNLTQARDMQRAKSAAPKQSRKDFSPEVDYRQGILEAFVNSLGDSDSEDEPTEKPAKEPATKGTSALDKTVPEVDYAESEFCKQIETLVMQAKENYALVITPDWHPTFYSAVDLAVGIDDSKSRGYFRETQELPPVTEPDKVRVNWLWKSNQQSSYLPSPSSSTIHDFKLTHAWNWLEISTQASTTLLQAKNLKLGSEAYKDLKGLEQEVKKSLKAGNQEADKDELDWFRTDFVKLNKLLDKVNKLDKEKNAAKLSKKELKELEDFDEYMQVQLLQWHELPSLALAISSAEVDYYRTKIHQVKLSPETLIALDYGLKLLQRQLRLDVSDRRWRQAITMIKANAYAAGRSTTIPADILILKHILWSQQNPQTTSSAAGAARSHPTLASTHATPTASCAKTTELISRTLLEAITSSMRTQDLPASIDPAWYFEREKQLRYQENPLVTLQYYTDDQRQEAIILRRENGPTRPDSFKYRRDRNTREQIRKLDEELLPKRLMLNTQVFSENLDWDALNQFTADIDAKNSGFGREEPTTVSKPDAAYDLDVLQENVKLRDNIMWLLNKHFNAGSENEENKEPRLTIKHCVQKEINRHTAAGGKKELQTEIVDKFDISVWFSTSPINGTLKATYALERHQLKGKLRPDIPADLRIRWAMQAQGSYLAGLKKAISFQEHTQYLHQLYRNKLCTRQELNQLQSITKIQATQAEKIISNNLSDFVSFVGLLNIPLHPGAGSWISFNSINSVKAVLELEQDLRGYSVDYFDERLGKLNHKRFDIAIWGG